MNRERIYSISILIFSIVMYLETFRFAEGLNNRVGPQVFPRVIIAIIFIFALISFIQSFRQKGTRSSFDLKNFLKKYDNTIILFIMFAVYVFLLQTIGFIFATLLFMFSAQALLMGIKKYKALFTNASVTLISTVTVYFIFTDILNVWLP